MSIWSNPQAEAYCAEDLRVTMADEAAESQGMIPLLTPAKATALELKAFSCRFIQEVVNGRDTNSPLFNKLDDDFLGSIEGISATNRRADYRKALSRLFELLPDYHTDIVNCVAEVDERGGSATVWITLKQSGWPGQTIRETISKVTWKRRRAGWTCLGYTGLDWSGVAPG